MTVVDRKPIRFWKAGLYGLVLMIFLYCLHLFTIWSGSAAPDPWLESSVPAHMAIAHWAAYFSVGPILFIAIAFLRNRWVIFRRKRI
ncbi:hypothetical protein UFOVP1349_17 [uncultured Caudovirales phage]|uniref:Uncharacterized protein n=1 Tax=uncultured Caudovirales phage TaxID=2100421 RepID=A0A6J5PIX1_9CAUD|nr:hypothetical protein UFOVP925_26 [uncultured Caudovirales phage]CAB4184069.1 hypothetical protein UFOVP1097_23 [uncultured Caudovirales phage]CAB4199880.1 hypothetical protein UFOVP1349_17 [uncultured Caudovirales phage]CAB4214638.1 hypothetical protein UFOVP1456_54 [uncultured Caudovirales phage]